MIKLNSRLSIASVGHLGMPWCQSSGATRADAGEGSRRVTHLDQSLIEVSLSLLFCAVEEEEQVLHGTCLLKHQLVDVYSRDATFNAFGHDIRRELVRTVEDDLYSAADLLLDRF